VSPIINGRRDNVLKGDSGGPLVCQDEGRWKLYGIVSWGSRVCADERKPTVYARAAAYVGWISKTISENS